MPDSFGFYRIFEQSTPLIVAIVRNNVSFVKKLIALGAGKWILSSLNFQQGFQNSYHPIYF